MPGAHQPPASLLCRWLMAAGSRKFLTTGAVRQFTTLLNNLINWGWPQALVRGPGNPSVSNLQGHVEPWTVVQVARPNTSRV